MQKPGPIQGPRAGQLLHSPLGLPGRWVTTAPHQPTTSVGSPNMRVSSRVSPCPKPRHLLSQEAQTYWEVEVMPPT